jgi:hypothetical protein
VRINARAGRAADPDATPTVWVAAAARDEMHLIRTDRRNLLLIGMDPDTRELLNELRSVFVEPITTWSPGERLVLPAHARTGTLILRDITALGLDDQIRLVDWLGAAEGRTQVVSITPRSPVPLIEAGAFLSILYYRLNTVCLDITRKQPRAPRPG